MKKKMGHITLLLSVVLMDLLAGMEFDLFIPSFPTLQAQLQLTPFWVEALLSVNFIGYCLGLFGVGALSDRYGRKPVILAGLFTFVVGSILCLSAGSYLPLLFGRLLQGLGVSAPAILSFLIVADHYPMDQQRLLLGILNGVMNAAVAIAPVIGSYITAYYDWPGNFTALLILGVAVLLLSICFIPNTAPVEAEAIALPSYVSLLKNRPLRFLMLNLVFTFLPYWVFAGMAPLLYIQDFGVPLLRFGYYHGVLALVFSVGSVLFGLVVNRYDRQRALRLSVVIFSVFLFSLCAVMLTGMASPLTITAIMLVFVTGQIMPTTILFPLYINYVPNAKGKVSALIQGARLLCSAISLQVASYFYHGSFWSTGILIAPMIVVIILTLRKISRTYVIA